MVQQERLYKIMSLQMMFAQKKRRDPYFNAPSSKAYPFHSHVYMRWVVFSKGERQLQLCKNSFIALTAYC